MTTVREGQKTDTLQVAHIEAACFSESAWSAKSLERSLCQSNCLLIVIESNAEVVGFALAQMVLDTSELLRMAVLPSHRRKGFGQTLLKQLHERSAQRGVEQMWLEVRADNVSAIQLYTSEEYTLTGRRPHYYRDGMDALVLSRTLKNHLG